MNPRIRILPPPGDNDLLGEWKSGWKSGQFLILYDGKLSVNMDEPHKLANSMKIWKGYGSTTILLFSLKGLEILHQERRGQGNTIVMGYPNSILFHKSDPSNKQHTYQSINIL